MRRGVGLLAVCLLALLGCGDDDDASGEGAGTGGAAGSSAGAGGSRAGGAGSESGPHCCEVVTVGWSQLDGSLWSRVSAPGCSVLITPTYRFRLRWDAAVPPSAQSYDLSHPGSLPTLEFGPTVLDAATGNPVSFEGLYAGTSGAVAVTSLPDPATFATSAGTLTDVTFTRVAAPTDPPCFHVATSAWDTAP